MKFTVQRPRLTVRLSPGHGTTECVFPVTSHHHVTKRLFTALPSTQVTCLVIEKKIIRQKAKKTHSQTKQATTQPDTAKMPELSDQEFRTTMTNTLRALMDKADRTQKQTGKRKQRDGNPEEEPERNSRHKTTVAEIEDAFHGLPSGLDMAGKSISELDDVATEMCRTEKQREQRQNPNRTPKACGTIREV